MGIATVFAIYEELAGLRMANPLLFPSLWLGHAAKNLIELPPMVRQFEKSGNGASDGYASLSTLAICTLLRKINYLARYVYLSVLTGGTKLQKHRLAYSR